MSGILHQLSALVHGETPRPLETALTYLVGVLVAAFIVAQSLASGAIIGVLESVVLFIVVMDVMSGVIANTTRSTSSFYRQRPIALQVGFLIVHAVHLLAIVLVLDPGNWAYFGGVYLYMLAAGTIVLLTPGELQRPLAFTLYGVGVVGVAYLLAPGAALAWVAPLYFAKLIVGFAVDHYGVRKAESAVVGEPRKQGVSHA